MATKEGLEIEAGNIVCEAMRGHSRYGDFHSTHEAYGVLAEEVSELLDAIHRNSCIEIEMESVQVAAVALRLAELCARYGSREFRLRSGL